MSSNTFAELAQFSDLTKQRKNEKEIEEQQKEEKERCKRKDEIIKRTSAVEKNMERIKESIREAFESKNFKPLRFETMDFNSCKQIIDQLNEVLPDLEVKVWVRVENHLENPEYELLDVDQYYSSWVGARAVDGFIK